MEFIKNFFAKWFRRFKIFVFVFAIWSVFFSVNTVIGNSIAFEYDDGFVYSGDVFRKVEKEGFKANDKDYWREINSNCFLERKKLVPLIMVYLFRFIGIKVDFIVDRDGEGGECLFKRWSGLAGDIHFVSNQDEKCSLLKEKAYLLFFPSSDEGIVQAQKSKVHFIRIKRNKKSASFLSYTPGKFGEKIIPLSEF